MGLVDLPSPNSSASAFLNKSLISLNLINVEVSFDVISSWVSMFFVEPNVG